ncbi:ferrous iron transport protein B [Anaeromyxobacter paludicola]|uniref:Ferrous iron transport protein B n=1 Tax=Anaeromyxobacter paludicola TaxID=2918171 RepID=A0ABM7X7H5_9BACT|nr:ferrous iron transport protein B [Anaeromyxobacter paludicola]BDG07785.1 ferrous iron transport protein B [Anaeromyxobacter paludicola]
MSHCPSPAAALDRKQVVSAARSVILVGNPNVGKSVLFGALTGKYVTVSNYPGTTVEVTRGSASIAGATWHVMDTPGTNNLLPMSEDEQVTRDILMSERDYACLQVCDAKNLRRGLLLAVQLAEAGVPFVLALNMYDEALGRGIAVDAARLSEELGIEVVPTVAVQRQGLPQLCESLARARPSRFLVRYDDAIEAAVAAVEPLLPSHGGLGKRALALMAIVGDPSLGAQLAGRMSEVDLATIEAERRGLAARYPESLRFVVSRQRLAAVDRLHDAVLSRAGARSMGSSLARRLGGWSTHPVLGLPVLAAVLFACYEFVGVFGAKTAVDFLENTVFYEHLVPWFDRLVRLLVPARGVQEFLVGPAGVPFREHGGLLVGRYGVFSMGLSYGMAIVLPIVTTFFLAFSFLEDSGYLPRLAVMVNKIFKRMGLNGKAVLPMVLGLGCDTMATMTARIMETRKERVIVTLLLALAVPCSAQLAVIFAMLGGVTPGAALWFAGTVLAVLFLVGWLAAKVIPGRGSDFMLELPPLRLPQAGNIAVKTLARIEWYLREALPLFILGTLILWGLDRIHGIAVLERVAAPVVVNLLHLPKEAATAFILGFLRRDYAAAGLFLHYEPFMKAGTMTREMNIEVTVALVTVTLFIPCIANFFMILKERGWKTGVAVAGFILPFAIGVGAVVDGLMRWLY